MSKLHTCSKRAGGLAVTTLPCSDGSCVHLSGHAYMPSCIRPEVRLPLDQRILWRDCCKKCRLLRLAQVLTCFPDNKTYPIIRPSVIFPDEFNISPALKISPNPTLSYYRGNTVVFSYFVLHSSKIPFVLTTKVVHLRSLLFRQPDGVNCVVRTVFLNPESADSNESTEDSGWVRKHRGHASFCNALRQ